MKISEIRELTMDDLRGKVVDMSEELFKLRFKNGIRQLENTAKLKDIRKNIARVKTVISEKKAHAA
jgi:large subunit ribosomal protein L29